MKQDSFSDSSFQTSLQVPQSSFVPFFPLNINGNIFADPLLTDLQKVIIAIAQMHRLKISYAKTEAEQKELLTEINSSMFSRATGKHRDHIRRIINAMQRDENVKKYLSIYIVPRSNVHLNEEQIFRFTFHDQLPDQFSVKHKSKAEMFSGKIPFHYEELINHYLHDMKFFQGETAHSLIELIGCEPAELVKGLLYLKQQTKRKEIKSPKGYLLSSFENGFFKYKINNYNLAPANSESKTTKDFLFKIPLAQMKAVELAHKQQQSNFRFYYLTENDFALIQKITCGGKVRNVQNYLTREKIPFQVVAAVNYGN